MPQRTALTLALGLTAFTLVILGGVIMAFGSRANPVAAQTEHQAVQVEAQPAAAPAPQPPTRLSPDQATLIAVAAAQGGTISGPPELVLFRGTLAYEVSLDRGVVYIDADAGTVLHNGAAVAQTVAATGRQPGKAQRAASQAQLDARDDDGDDHPDDDHDQPDDDNDQPDDHDQPDDDDYQNEHDEDEKDND